MSLLLLVPSTVKLYPAEGRPLMFTPLPSCLVLFKLVRKGGLVMPGLSVKRLDQSKCATGRSCTCASLRVATCSAVDVSIPTTVDETSMLCDCCFTSSCRGNSSTWPEVSSKPDRTRLLNPLCETVS